MGHHVPSRRSRSKKSAIVVAPAAAVRTCRRRVVRTGSACPRRAVFSCSASVGRLAAVRSLAAVVVSLYRASAIRLATTCTWSSGVADRNPALPEVVAPGCQPDPVQVRRGDVAPLRQPTGEGRQPHSRTRLLPAHSRSRGYSADRTWQANGSSVSAAHGESMQDACAAARLTCAYAHTYPDRQSLIQPPECGPVSNHSGPRRVALMFRL